MNVIDKRPGEALLSDLLPYVYYDQHSKLLWLKDGSASKTFSVTPKNCMSFTDDELAGLRSGLTSVLSQIPENTFVQFFLTREKTSSKNDLAFKNWSNSHFSSGGDNHKNAERLFESKKETLDVLWSQELLFQTRVYVTVRTSPYEKAKTGAQTGVFSHIIFNRESKAKFKSKGQIESETIQTFEQLKQGLESLSFEIQEMGGDEIFDITFRFLNPERKITKQISFDSARNLSEQMALSELIESRTGLTLGRTELKIGTLKTMPESSVPALMQSLATLGSSYHFVLTILILPQMQERERLSRKQRLAQGMSAGDRVRNLQAETQLQDIEETMTAMISSGEKLLATSAHVLVFEEVM
jgi:hypothetical protein